MKKLISLIICTALLIISLVGCGGESEIQAPTDELNLEFYYDDKIMEEYSIKGQMNETIVAYKKLYPKVTVNVEFKPFDYGTDKGEESNKQLAAEIMAGKGSDVIIMDNLFIRTNDIYKMQQGGAFVDLTPYIENDLEFKTDNLKMQIVSAGKIQDAQYLMPSHYSLGLFVGSKSSLEKTGLDTPIFKNTDTIVNSLTKYYENKKYDTMQRFFPDVNWLANFPLFMNIKLVNRDTQAVEMNDYFEKGMDFFKVAYTTEERLPNPMYDQKASSGYGRYFEKNDNMPYATDFYLYTSSIIKLINQMREISKNESPIVHPWRNQTGEVTALVSEAMAINSASRNKQNAWNFIRMCIVNDSLYQHSSCSRYAGGFPVNNESMNKFIDEYSEKELIGENDMPLATLTAEQQEDIIEITNEVTDAVFPAQMNRTMAKFFIEYAEDKITREECLQQIEDYLKIYISE